MRRILSTLLVLTALTCRGEIVGSLTDIVGAAYKVDPVFKPLLTPLSMGTNVLLGGTRKAITTNGVFRITLMPGSYDAQFGDIATIKILVPDTNTTYTFNQVANLYTNLATFLYTNNPYTLWGYLTNGDARSVSLASNLTVRGMIIGNGAGLTNVSGATSTNFSLATNYASGAMSQQHFLNAESYEGHRRFFNTIPFAGTLSWYSGGVAFASESWMSNQMYVAETSGWLAAGANMLLIDDGWQGGRTNGVISEFASRWPSGLSNMIRNAHSRGFKVGIYTEPNVTTSGGMPGSLGYLTNDAARFVQWGVDLVKFDVFGSTNREHHVAELSAALDRYGFQGHLHVGLGATDYAPWVSRYAESWRCSIAGAVDVTAATVIEAKQNILRNFDQMNRFPASSGPGRSGQLDSIPTWTGPSDPEALRTVSAIVGMMGGPMLMHSYRPTGEGNFAATFATLSNTVAIIRDGAGMPPVCVWSTNVPAIPPSYGTNIGQQVWVRPLGNAAGPYKAVMLLNRDTNAAATISLNWTNLGFAGGENITFSDIYHATNAAVSSMTVTVPAMTALLFKAIPTALLSSGSGLTAVPSPLIVTNTTAADGSGGSLSFSFTNSPTGSRIAGGSVLAGLWNGLMFSSPQVAGSGGIEYQWCNLAGGTNETVINIPQYSSAGRITFRNKGDIITTVDTNGVIYGNASGLTNLIVTTVTNLTHYGTNIFIAPTNTTGANLYGTALWVGTNTTGTPWLMASNASVTVARTLEINQPVTNGNALLLTDANGSFRLKFDTAKNNLLLNKLSDTFPILTGTGNIGIGSGIMYWDIGANNNVAIGMGTGGNSGSDSVSIAGTVMGSYGVAIRGYATTYGIGVGYGSIGRDQGVAIGTYSKSETNSIGIGYYSMYATSNAPLSVAVGYSAGWNGGGVGTSYADSKVTFLGANSGRSLSLALATPLTNAVAIGYNAKAHANNSFTIGGQADYALALCLNPMRAAPTNIPFGTPYFFSTTNAGIAEISVVDGAGTTTQISPHADDAPAGLYDYALSDMKEIIFKDENPFVTNGIVSFINLRRMARMTEIQTRAILYLCGVTNSANSNAVVRLKGFTTAQKQVLMTEDFATYNARTGNNLQTKNWDDVQNQSQAAYDFQRVSIDQTRAWLTQSNAVITASGDTNTPLFVLPEALPVKNVKLPKPAWLN